MEGRPAQVTIQEYAEHCRRVLKEKLAGQKPHERHAYEQGFANLKNQALGGLGQWTDEKLVGALFMSSSLKAAAEAMHQLGMIDHVLMEWFQHVVEEQENIAVALRDGLV